MEPTLSVLNDRFAIADHLSFIAGPGDLPIAQIRNKHASAQICLLGAHVLAFQPRGQDPVLWMSDKSWFEVGKAIRGGIPVCWPWFAGHPTDSSKPSHGVVRTRLWTVLDSRARPDGSTQIEFGIESNADTMALWPHVFALRLIVTVADTLTVTLISHNPGAQPFTYTGALHSYFQVNRAAEIAIHGLEDNDYVEKPDSLQRKSQQGPIRIVTFTNRIYLDTINTCIIEDPGLRRQIHVAKSGSRTTVVWNPWQDGAARQPDFSNDGYEHMVCVETAKAVDDVATVHAGGEHRLEARIWVERT